MVYSPHGKIVLQGEFGENGSPAVEQWSASMSYDVVGPDVGAMPATLPEDTLEAIAAAWRTFFTAPNGGDGSAAMFDSSVTLSQVCYYRADGLGHATGGQWQRHFLTPVARGASTIGNRWPLQIASVISLDAGGPRGGRFGRFYLPPITNSIGADFRWSQAVCTSLATKARTALTAVNTALSADIDGDVELVVASGRGFGENRPVRFVRAGRVPDTMRSRRESLAEEYSVLGFQTIP